MKKIVLFGLFIISSIPLSFAQEKREPAKTYQWGAEVNVLWPFFPGLYEARIYRHLWQKNDFKGELVIGGQYRPEEFRSDEGNFREASAHVGYRQYFWKGLHLHHGYNLGQGRIRESTYDGKDYRSFDVEMRALVGYTFDIGQAKRWYIQTQHGTARVIYKSNPHPQPTNEQFIYMGNLIIGIRF